MALFCHRALCWWSLSTHSSAALVHGPALSGEMSLRASSSERGDEPLGEALPLHVPTSPLAVSSAACQLVHAEGSLCLSTTAGPAGRSGSCRVLALAPPSLQTAAPPPGSLPDPLWSIASSAWSCGKAGGAPLVYCYLALIL